MPIMMAFLELFAAARASAGRFAAGQSTPARALQSRGYLSTRPSSARSLGLGRRTHQRFGKAVRDVEPRLLGDFDETRRTGDVDLCQIVADDVEADDQQTVCP